MDIIELYNKIDGDAETTLHRFGGNNALLERFVKKFPDDRSFSEILSAAETNDFDAMERGAHTLKGTSANLGFQGLSDRCANLVTALREGKKESTELVPLIENIRGNYDQIIELISTLD